MRASITRRRVGIAALALFLSGVAGTVSALTVQPVAEVRETAGSDATNRIIVRLKPAYRGERTQALPSARANDLAVSAGVALRPVRAMSGDAQVVAIPNAMKRADVQAIVDRIRRNPMVESAEVDAREHLMAVPNDPFFSQQTYLQPPGAAPLVSAVNAPAAWDVTRGTSSPVVAVVDGGARFDHPDLVGRLINGYDFVSADCTLAEANCSTAIQFTTANDGNGRDSDASDPGDWVTAADKANNRILADCTVEDSTWHGTHIAGIIGAAGNNALGIAGLNWNANILVVRVSGRCGAYRSDVIDGMRWAVGLSVPNVPANTRPARIVNVSLGSAGSCSTTYGQAVTDILGANGIIVAAAGNEDGPSIQPANCSGVIAVGAVRGDGMRTSYSNSGADLTIMAPGGDYVQTALNDRLVSTNNSGRTTPATYTSAGYYVGLAGTSFSTPVVSGTVSLMLSVNPSLTNAQVIDILRSTARPFVAVAGSATCVPGGLGAPDGSQRPCNCTTAACGAGYVDAGAAVARAQGAVAPAPPVNPPSSGGGGGGGGGVGGLGLAVLVAVGWATRALRRRPVR